MAGTFTLSIVAPEGNVLKKDVEFVVLPSELGELGILRSHAPLIAGLENGVLRYTESGAKKKVAISGGFVEVKNNLVTVLAETAEAAENIDLNRALAAKERAEKRLTERVPGTDMKRAEIALRKAVTRISAKEGEVR